jgi:D-sedoheptulose 7-phosphate isomerase
VKGRFLKENLSKLIEVIKLVSRAFEAGNKVFFFGNGGSAADSQHLAAEFVGRFQMERSGLPAVSLTTDTSILTSIGNDYGFGPVFSRQLEALAEKGDLLFIFSTSGKSGNVISAARKAKEMGLKTVALTGKSGGPLKRLADITLIAPGKNTARIQEAHILIGHILAEITEEALFQTSDFKTKKERSSDKIKNLNELLLETKRLKASGKKIVFTNGCFDLLHGGHLKLLQEAKAQGDVLIIGLNSDSSVKKLKGPDRPLLPERERAELLANLEPVDYVVVFKEETPKTLIQKILPDVLVKGAEYKPNQIVGRETVQKHGGKVVRIPLLPNRSTSKLISKL